MIKVKLFENYKLPEGVVELTTPHENFDLAKFIASSTDDKRKYIKTFLFNENIGVFNDERTNEEGTFKYEMMTSEDSEKAVQILEDMDIFEKIKSEENEVFVTIKLS